MNKYTHGIIQVLGLIVQYGNAATSVVPDKYKPLVAAGIGLIQTIVALANHKTASGS